MKRTEMVKYVRNFINEHESKDLSLTTKQINAVIDAYNDLIIDAVYNEQNIKFANGFAITGVPVEARSKFCHFTNKFVDIPPHIIPKLKVSKEFKQDLNGVNW